MGRSQVCTQLGTIEESEFDRELKKVIFSHVEGPYRLGRASLDELIVYKAAEANQKGDLLKQELHRINERIIALEEKAEPEYRKPIENLLDRKSKELTAHETSKPAVVAKPENHPAGEKQIAETSEAIEGERIAARRRGQYPKRDEATGEARSAHSLRRQSHCAAGQPQPADPGIYQREHK